MSPWALKGVFFLLLIATVPMSTFAAPNTKVEEAKTEVKRVNREIRDLDLDDFQSVLPVQVDLSSAMGVVVHHLKMLEKNVSSFQSRIENRIENTIRDVLKEKETTCSNEKHKDNTPPKKEEEGQSHTSQVTQSKSHSQSRTEATKAPDSVPHESSKNGSPATVSPPIIDPFSGLSWESILGGCAMNSSELDGWVLLQYRDVKNAGSVFWSMSDEEYEIGYNLHPSRKYAYWIGLKTMREFYYQHLYDFVLAYHCEGLVRCTRYSNFVVRQGTFNYKNTNQLWFDNEMHHEGMYGHLLDQYIGRSFGSDHDYMGRIDPREACINAAITDGHWWFHRCNTLCPTCKNIGGKFEDIGFDASKCTHTFMAARAMI